MCFTCIYLVPTPSLLSSAKVMQNQKKKRCGLNYGQPDTQHEGHQTWELCRGERTAHTAEISRQSPTFSDVEKIKQMLKQ